MTEMVKQPGWAESSTQARRTIHCTMPNLLYKQRRKYGQKIYLLDVDVRVVTLVDAPGRWAKHVHKSIEDAAKQEMEGVAKQAKSIAQTLKGFRYNANATEDYEKKIETLLRPDRTGEENINVKT